MTEHSKAHTVPSGCCGGKTTGLVIAVFIRSDRKPAELHSADRIVFYEKRKEDWVEKDVQFLKPLQAETRAEMNAFLKQVMHILGETQVVAASAVTGLAFSELNRSGKHIFEIPEISTVQLSGIAEDIALAEAKSKMKQDTLSCAVPQETDTPGIYSLDLIKALDTYPELSSKMILKPFLKKTPFTELILLCKHVPLWLSREAGLEVEKRKRDEFYIVTIRKTVCQEVIS